MEEIQTRFGLLTDPHFAQREPFASRHYSDALVRMCEAIDVFTRERVDWVIELGDMIDRADSLEVETGWLHAIDREYARFPGARHYVLGNHCVSRLTKDLFRAQTASKEWPYAFTSGGVRFLVLDACFRGDGVAYGAGNFEWTDSAIPPFERDWIACELSRAQEPVVVFVHQRLDTIGDYAIGNAAAVREILSESGKVLAVFQGHEHENDDRVLDGVRYVTFAAMVEGESSGGNAYAIVEIAADGAIHIRGFRTQASYRFAPPRCVRCH